MNEFTIRVDRLAERLRRGTAQCDRVEQRACLAEQRLSTLNESVQMLARLIEVSLLILASSDKERLAWMQVINGESDEMTNPILRQFLHRLESYLRRSINDDHEKREYIQALYLLRTPSVASSRFFQEIQQKDE